MPQEVEKEIVTLLQQLNMTGLFKKLFNECWFLFPVDEDEEDGEGCEDHDAPHPGLEGSGHHGHQGDEDGGEDVEDGSDQANPDGPLLHWSQGMQRTAIPIETWNIQYSAEWPYALKYFR